jgi:hypothetical protein
MNVKGLRAALLPLQVQAEDGTIIGAVDDVQSGELLFVVPVGCSRAVAARCARTRADTAAAPAPLLPTAPPVAPLQSVITSIVDSHPSAPALSEVVEMQVLACANASDFRVARVVGGGQNGIVFAVHCTRAGLPYPHKLYALKMVYNFGASPDAKFDNEYNALSQLPPHSNLNRFWTQFRDEVSCFLHSKHTLRSFGTMMSSGSYMWVYGSVFCSVLRTSCACCL